MKKNLYAIALAFAAVSLWSEPVVAVTYEFKDKYTFINRVLNNPTIYSEASPGFPGLGGAVDDWQVAGYGDGIAAFTMSQSLGTAFRVVTFKIGGPNGKGEPGSGFILDMSNYEIYFPPLPDGQQYARTPFVIQSYYSDNDYCASGDKNAISLESMESASVPVSWAVMRMERLLLDARMVNGDPTFDFQRGVLNFYDPSGSPLLPVSSCRLVLNHNIEDVPQKIYFREAVTMKATEVEATLGGSSTDYSKNYVNFDGARLWVARSFTNNGGDVHFGNGAQFTADALKLGNANGVVTLENPGTVGTFSNATASVSVNGLLYVRDGAELNATGPIAFPGTSAASILYVDNASVWNGENTITTSANSTFVLTNNAEVSCAKIYANGFFGMYSGSRINLTTASQDLTLYGETMISGDGTSIVMTNGTLAVANPGIEITDGAEVDAKALYFNGGRSHIVVRNGAKLSTSRGDTAVIDTNAASGNLKYLLVDGGEYSGGNIDIGCGDGNAKVQLDGGSITLAGGEGIRMQQGGSSTVGCTASLIVNDGKLRCGRIRPARKTTDAQDPKGDTRIEMNGGRIELTDNSNGLLYFQNTTGSPYTRSGTQYLTLNGGVLAASKIWKGDNTTGTIVLSANGGTFEARTTTSESSPAIGDVFSVAAFAEKGFTIDTHGYSTYVDFNPENETAKVGLFRKAGTGTLSYSGVNSVSKLEVIGGTFKMANAAASFSGVALSITNNAVFSTEGASTGVTVSSLYVNGGTLLLDEGDVIRVEGALDVSHLKVDFVSLPAGPTAFLEVAGTLSDAQKTAIRTTEFVNTIGDDQHAAFDFETAGGVTTVKIRVAQDTPLTDGVIWKGSSGGNWSTAGNWEGGVPTSAKRALFVRSSAGKRVTVTSGSTAGALTFGLDGYQLTGSLDLSLKGEKGACDIVTSNGTSKIESPLQLESRTMVHALGSSTLELLGVVNHGALTKTGTGKLKLSRANKFDNGVVSTDGTLELTDEKSLSRGTGSGELVLKSGTVTFSGNATNVADRIVVNATNVNDFAAFKTDVDTVFHEIDVKAGSFIKRGAGKLTIDIPEGLDYQLGVGGGTAGSYSLNKPGVTFPDNGTAPDPGTPSASGASFRYFGFGVYEGELYLKGEGSGAKAHILATGLAPSSVGSVSVGCSVDPVLTVDNVDFNAGNNGFLVGDQLGDGGLNPKSATLNIINNGSVTIRTTQIGYGVGNQSSHAYINATNGTLRFTGSVHLTRSYMTTDNWVAYSFKDSSLLSDAATQTLGGGIRLDFDHSYFGGADGSAIVLNSETYRPNGELLFRNGSTLMMSAFQEDTNNRELNFVFDDSEWAFNGDRSDATLSPSANGVTHYVMRGKGVIFKPSLGSVYFINAPLEGEGGMQVQGPGTVKLGEGMLQYDGATIVSEGGIVDCSSLTDPVAGHVFGGSGTFYGLPAEAPRIAAALNDRWQNTNGVPVFASSALDGYVTVLTGRTDDDPLEFSSSREPTAIARISGTTAVDLSHWRLDRVGVRKAGAQFTLIGDTIYLVPASSSGSAAVIR